MHRLKGLRDANERAKLTVNLAIGLSCRKGAGTNWTLVARRIMRGPTQLGRTPRVRTKGAAAPVARTIRGQLRV